MNVMVIGQGWICEILPARVAQAEVVGMLGDFLFFLFMDFCSQD